MAELICTLEEYYKFVDPRIRNRIQTLTRKKKKELNHICQNCGETRELEAAHKKGKERKLIIKKILKKHLKNRGDIFYRINLQEIEDEIVSKHKPIEDHFLFLCSECHKKYDSEK